MKNLKSISVFSLLVIGVIFISCRKEEFFAPEFPEFESSMLKSGTVINCETMCIDPANLVYFEKTDSKTTTWGGPKKPKTNIVDIVYYNTLTHFVLKVKSNNGWNDLVINGVSTWVNGPVAPGIFGEYSVVLPAGWKACDDYNFSLQVTGNGPPALFQVSYKLIGECQKNSVTDMDGNTYETVSIGSQIWMAENLKTTKYSDGTTVPNVTEYNSWMTMTSGAYCWYNNDESNKDYYGALYNWYATNSVTNGGKNLCPDGWHVSTDEDWKQLEIGLGMPSDIANTTGPRSYGVALKLKSTWGWYGYGNGTNSTGFSALPAGMRYSLNGVFQGMEYYAWFWTATEYDEDFAWHRILYAVYPESINRLYSNNKANGFSVRCVKN